jgi:hypothetical protein
LRCGIQNHTDEPLYLTTLKPLVCLAL